MANPLEAIICDGFVRKKKQHKSVLGAYNTRWFELTGSTLTYCSKPDDRSIKGSYNVADFIGFTHNAEKLQFEIVTAEKVLTLKAESEVELDRWVKGVTFAMRLQLYQNAIHKPESEEEESSEASTPSARSPLQSPKKPYSPPISPFAFSSSSPDKPVTAKRASAASTPERSILKSTSQVPTPDRALPFFRGDAPRTPPSSSRQAGYRPSLAADSGGDLARNCDSPLVVAKQSLIHNLLPDPNTWDSPSPESRRCEQHEEGPGGQLPAGHQRPPPVRRLEMAQEEEEAEEAGSDRPAGGVQPDEGWLEDDWDSSSNEGTSPAAKPGGGMAGLGTDDNPGSTMPLREKYSSRAQAQPKVDMASWDDDDDDQ